MSTVTETTLPVEHEPSHDPDERALFSRLAASMARHRKAVILVWIVVTLAAAPLAITLTKALSGAGWDAKGSVAEEVRKELRSDFPALGAENPIVVYRQESRRSRTTRPVCKHSLPTWLTGHRWCRSPIRSRCRPKPG